MRKVRTGIYVVILLLVCLSLALYFFTEINFPTMLAILFTPGLFLLSGLLGVRMRVKQIDEARGVFFAGELLQAKFIRQDHSNKLVPGFAGHMNDMRRRNAGRAHHNYAEFEFLNKEGSFKAWVDASGCRPGEVYDLIFLGGNYHLLQK